MTFVAAALGCACLVVAAIHLLRLRLDPVGEGAHALMGLGMAAMFLPALDLLPAPVWTAAFVVVGAWFGAHALRGGGAPAVHQGDGRADGGGPGREWTHVLGAVAMLVMLLGGHGDAAPEGAGDAGHVAHGGGPDGGLGWGSLLALVLAAYFVWHLLRCTEPLRSAGGPATGGAVRTRVTADPRVAAAAHATMAVAMVVMLLGAV